MVSWLTCLGLKSGRLIQQTEREEGAVWLSLPPCLCWQPLPGAWRMRSARVTQLQLMWL